MCIVNECDETVPLNTDDPHMMVMLDGAKAELLQMARQQVLSKLHSEQNMHIRQSCTTLHRILTALFVILSMYSLINWEYSMDDFPRNCLLPCRWAMTVSSLLQTRRKWRESPCPRICWMLYQPTRLLMHSTWCVPMLDLCMLTVNPVPWTKLMAF